MRPAARTQAAIELLDAIIAAAREGGAAADTLIVRYFAARRYAGSKDRRAVRDLVYAAIRACGELPPSGRAAMLALARRDAALAATFDGSAHAPAPIVADEPVATEAAAPAWIGALLRDAGIDVESWPALVSRAPLDVRLRHDVSSAELIAAVPDAARIAGLEHGWRLPAGTDMAAFAGRAEIQDAGSQMVALAAQAAPGMTIVDLCAGAGGKTLAIGDAIAEADAAGTAPQSRLIACDVDRARLSRLAPRAQQADLSSVETRLLDPGREMAGLADLRAAADVVFVDAPCSGTGTWRRNPEARWRLTPSRLERLMQTQAHVLDVAAPLVRPGGALIYVVCSLLDNEGRGQVDAFLARHAGWHADTIARPFGEPHGAGRRLNPARDHTDGFFVARLLAPC
ncbi:RsmB/NOP family class I SAM-dependent RNA methyltransferase [Sphingomonas sp. NBWT7]|uniref:RsmB/NOP family class I SAM-dependent RNA methyltransferase n=1 Tax=Sphingomonas sp. NBWT7 TaxID=2596913 RepID=UPI00162657BC|nr:RsmB/NOP family class I SAM-dependent RNA methyltransferase [Sphingomonas sp. NBWT7]QNE31263.1 RsmB/NOP family class I SAM-dependent RNA methyltransferase [Sphingomonas sp. NBWT7]